MLVLLDPSHRPLGAGRRCILPSGHGAGMNWIAHYFDRRLNRDSRAFASKEDALREACDLTRRSCVVHFVQGPNDEKIDAVAIAAWCKHHPWRRDPPKPPK